MGFGSLGRLTLGKLGAGGGGQSQTLIEMTNPGFDSDISGWTSFGSSTVAYDSGAMKLTVLETTTANGGRYQDVAMPVSSGSGTLKILSKRDAVGGVTCRVSLFDGAGFSSSIGTTGQISNNVGGDYVQTTLDFAWSESTVRVYINIVATVAATDDVNWMLDSVELWANPT